MTRKIEKIQVDSVQAGSSRAHEIRLHLTFNEEAVKFLTLKGQYFTEKSSTLIHLLSIPKEVYDGDEYFRNKYIANTMRAVKSDYEDVLELNDVTPSEAEGRDIAGFCLCLDTDSLLDPESAVLEEEAPPPPEPVEESA